MTRQKHKNVMTRVALISALLLSASYHPAYAAASDVDGYLQSAREYVEADDLPAAVIELRNAQQLAPQDGEIRFELAQLYLRINQVNNADAEIIAAAQRGVSEDRLAPLRAEAMYRQGEFVELLRDVPAANRPAPIESVVRTYRGLAEMVQGNALQAGAMLDDAEQLAPTAVLPKMSLARLFFSDGDHDAAENKADEVLTLSPNYSEALDLKGGIALIRGDGDQALEYYNAAIEQDPQNGLALLHRAALQIDLRDLAAAEGDVQAALAIQRGNIAANYLDALIKAAQNNYDGADEILTNMRAAMEQLPDAYFLGAVTKYQLGQPEQAEAYLDRYVATRPEDARGHVLLGKIALDRRDAGDAIESFQRALQITPGDLRAASFLSQAYVMNGEASKAIDLLNESVQQVPENTGLRAQLALNQFGAGQAGAAIDELTDVFNEGAGDLRAGPSLVLAALRAGRNAEAEEAVASLIEQDPDNILYQELLASTLINRGDLAGAEDILQSMLNAQPDLIAARRNLSQVYMGMNRPDDAKALFEERLAEAPNDADSMSALAELLVREGNYDRAVELFDRARQASPSNPAPGMQLVAAYAEQNKWADAVREARALQTAFPQDIAVRDLFARVYANSGDVTTSLATFRQAITAFPDSAVLYSNFARVLEGTDDNDGAIDALEEAILLAPADDDLKRRLISLSYRSEGADAALEKAQTIARRNPTNPIGNLLAADVLQQSGRAPRAITLLEDAQEENPSADIAVRLAALYQGAGDGDRAIGLLENWIETNPNDIAPHRTLAQLYGLAGNEDAAVREYEWIAVALPNDALVQNNLAYIYSERGDPRALEMAQRAFRLAPQSANIADTLGWIMTKGGDAENGVTILERASTAMPDNREVQYHYAVALNELDRNAEAREILERIVAGNEEFDSRADAVQLLEAIAP